MSTIQQPPGPRRPAVVNMVIRQFQQANFHLKLARKYGDVVHFKFGPVDVYLVSHPDYIRDVLVVNHKKFAKIGKRVSGQMMLRELLGNGLLLSENEFHLRQRRLMQPAFHRQRIAAYAQVMAEYAARTSERWRQLPAGTELDMAEEMMRLTLSVVGRTLFDADVERDAPDVGQAMAELFTLFNRTISPVHFLLDKLRPGSGDRFRRARGKIDDIIYRTIKERRADGKDHGDLLSMLLLAQDEEGGTGRMSDEQVRDEAITLFLAGHETTALALAWTWYLLAQHPDIEAKLHAELDEVLGGRQPTLEDVPRLRYTEMVVAEVLRLYPPAWMISRAVREEHEIGGYTVAPDCLVLISPYVVHHDPRYYPDPFKFDPERWTPEAKESRPKFSYFPFGGGNRICIGESFAWMEAILILATLAQQWRPRLSPGQQVTPQAMITLRPKHGIKMTLERRGGQ
jgi:cytochrome P450